MTVKVSCTAFDLSGPNATLAAVQTRLTAAVATMVAAGFIPESISPFQAVAVAGQVDGVMLGGSASPKQNWLTVTAASAVLVPLNGAATLAALNVLIAAAITTANGTATPDLRGWCVVQTMIAGNQVDLLALLFSDGAPAVS